MPEYSNMNFDTLQPKRTDSTDTEVKKILQLLNNGLSTTAPTGGASSANQTNGSQLTQITDPVGSVLTNSTSGGDALTNTNNRLRTSTHLNSFNGTTWDRVRSGFTAVVSSVVGYLNSLPYAIFNTTLPTLTNGQAVVTQCDANGKLIIGTRSSGVTQSPTVSTAPAYSIGDVVGGKLTFANVFDLPASGVFHSLRVNCKSIQTATLKFYLFRDDPATSTFIDNNAPAIATADFDKVVGVYTLSSPDNGLGTHTIWNLDGISKVTTGAGGSTTLYGVLITSTAMTLASTTDIMVAMNTLRD